MFIRRNGGHLHEKRMRRWCGRTNPSQRFKWSSTHRGEGWVSFYFIVAISSSFRFVSTNFFSLLLFHLFFIPLFARSRNLVWSRSDCRFFLESLHIIRCSLFIPSRIPREPFFRFLSPKPVEPVPNSSTKFSQILCPCTQIRRLSLSVSLFFKALHSSPLIRYFLSYLLLQSSEKAIPH